VKIPIGHISVNHLCKFRSGKLC